MILLCRLITFTLLFIYPHLANAICVKSTIPTPGFGIPQAAYYRCPLDTDKAALTNVNKGDLAYGEDTFTLYIATDTTPTWLVVSNPTSLVNSVSNSDGSLTISPTTGNVIASLNIAHSNTWLIRQNVDLNVSGLVTPINDTIIQLAGRDGNHSFIWWNAWGGSPTILATGSNGTAASPTAITAGAAMYRVFGRSYDGTVYSGNSVGFNLKAWTNWTATNHSTYIPFFTTPVGSTTLTQIAYFAAGGGLSVGNTSSLDVADGIINAMTGFTVSNNATSGNVLRGDGTNFISAQLNLTDLGTFSSADLANRLTDESGTGVAVYNIGASLSSVTPFSLRDSSAAFNVTLKPTSSPILSSGRILTLNMGNVDHTINYGTTAGSITFPNTAADTVAMLGVANNFTASQTITGTGQMFTLSLTPGFFLASDGGGSSDIIFQIRPLSAKNGWLTFADHSAGDRWAIGIKGSDTNLYISSGGVGSLTDRMIIPNSSNGKLTWDFSGVAHTVILGTTANTITFPNVASDTVAMLNTGNIFGVTQSVTLSGTGPAAAFTVVDNGTAIGNGGIFTATNTSTTVNSRALISMSSAEGAGARFAAIFTQHTPSMSANFCVQTRNAGVMAEKFCIGSVGGLYTFNVTGGDKGLDTINTTTYYAGGTAGVSQTFTMCKTGACATTCTIITTGGIVTGGTC